MVYIEDVIALLSGNFIKLIGAILILLIGLLISRFLSKLSLKVLNKLKMNLIVKSTFGLDVPAEEFLSTGIRYILYLTSMIYALNQLGITTFILKFILSFILILIIILILLSLKDIVPNIIAGLFLHQRKLINMGDKIKVKNIKGKVIEITTTETKLETDNNDIIIIPNRVLIKNEIIKEK